MHVNDASELICIKWYFIMVRFSCMYLQVNAIVITDALDLVSFYLLFDLEQRKSLSSYFLSVSIKIGKSRITSLNYVEI